MSMKIEVSDSLGVSDSVAISMAPSFPPNMENFSSGLSGISILECLLRIGSWKCWKKPTSLCEKNGSGKTSLSRASTDLFDTTPRESSFAENRNLFNLEMMVLYLLPTDFRTSI